MTKRRTLLDDVMEQIPRKGFTPWYERISADLLDELTRLRSQFWRGELGRATKTGLSYALAKSLRDRGVDIGHAGVRKWLEDKRD